nr:hypothetical protein [Actinomycetota bacterium]
MPSIQDVADQINAKLDQINQNTADTVTVGNGIRSDLAQTNTKLDALDTDLVAGVAEISAGLFAIWELEKVTNAILEHHSKQSDTIICLLENANELLCGMTRKLARQLDLSERQLDSMKRIEGITERVHADAAGAWGAETRSSRCGGEFVLVDEAAEQVAAHHLK